MKSKIALYSLIISLIITIIGTSLTLGRILERIDIIVIRLSKIENHLDRLHDHEKRIVILEEKVYNIEKGK
jgi:hypothetical protein